jgi:amino acid adenylation domain-containing protein
MWPSEEKALEHAFVRDLRGSLATKLPPSLIPALIVVAELPRTASGAIDLDALPAAERAGENAPTVPATDDADDDHLRYWRAQLANLPVRLELLFERARPAAPTHEPGRHQLVLEAGLSRRLEALARGHDTTLYVTMLAAFQALLHRYSGQDDIVIGTPRAANQVVLRTDLSGAPTFGELLGRTRQTTLAAFAHDGLPFDRLVAALAPPRGAGFAPLFLITFALDAISQAPGVEHPSHDLGMTVVTGDTITVTLEFSLDVFDEPAIVQFGGRFVRLLEGAVTRPGARIDELPLMSPNELQRRRAEWSCVDPYIADQVALHALIEQQADRTPDRIAVRAKDRELSYAELDRHTNELARRLCTAGIGRGDVVGVSLDRSIEMVCAVLATLKAGAAYLPLDPELPRDRIRWMLADARARAVITRQSELATGALVLIRPDDIATGTDAKRLVLSVSSDDLAYVIYTSGSTGTPKGVAVEHGSISAYVRSAVADYQLTELDRVLQFASLSWDTSCEEIFPTLASGGTLVLRDPSMTDSVHGFLRSCERERLTVLNLPTAFWHELVVALSEQGVPSLSGVRLVIIGGEHANAERLARWFELVGDRIRLVNTYGMTEATAVSTTCNLAPLIPARTLGARVPLGAPIAGVHAYVLDDRLDPAPPGLPGELWIGGVGLARGYLHRPSLTAERFVPNPFAAGQRLYRTGDVARVRGDGMLEYLGRSDHQVKIRGIRVELGEIETTLTKHPDVRTAVVVARNDVTGHKMLVAYLTTAANIDDVRRFAADLLPAYMVPAAFVVLGLLPLTPSGKIDRRALLALPTPDPRGVATYRPPQTREQELLANLWSQLLGIERVGLDDNFFQLGGHSLIATRLTSQVRELFGVELALRAVFETPTLAGLTQTIAMAHERGQASSSRIEPQPRTAETPLSLAQQRLWLVDRITPGSALYNLSTAFSLDGVLDVAALEYALRELHRRHETLRSTFASHGADPVVVFSDVPFAVSHLDVEATNDVEREIRERIAAEVTKPFDLSSDLPWRALLLRASPTEHVLVVTMHHIVTDGWSLDVMAHELGVFYTAHRDGKMSPLGALALQYGDFAIWQRAHLPEVLDRQLAYWKHQLAGAPPLLELPIDHPRPATPSYRGGRYVFKVGLSLMRRLEALSRDRGVTLYMTMLAAYQVLLHRISRHDDILVGTPIAGRTRGETEGLVGFFVNTLVMRANLAGNPTFAELLSRVRETALAAYAHQDVPFEKLVDELNPERSLSYSPLFQAFFSLERPYAANLELPGVTSTGGIVDNPLAKFDLSMEIIHGDDTAVQFSYARDLFDDPTIVRMASQFVELLDAIVAQPDGRVDELDIVPADERHRLVVEWNQTEVALPERCMHEPFEAQVDRTPDAIALVFDTKELTYRELDARANQLAHQLRALGVGPGALVGIFVERSLEMVVGMLATLKAGGAYVPIDPAYPNERVEFLLDDAHCVVTLTQTKLVPRLPAQRKSICLDTAPCSGQPTTRAPVATSPEHVAYLIYTSGSTGKPKGVAIRHANAATLIQWAHRVFTRAELAAVLAGTSICFDLSIFEIFVPLAMGGTVIVAATVLELQRIAARDRVTLVNTVPSAIAELLRVGGVPASVMTVNLAGEPLTDVLVQKIYELGHVERVYDLYGPSEDTTYSTFALRARGPNSVVTIGRPIANTRAYVLDARGALAPLGTTGELYLGGAGLALGYHGRPGLTAERFVPDAFGRGGRLYRTGDLVKWRNDGTLEFLGRLDHQVKVRGYRIELGEIESVLAKHPGVKEVTVVVREDELSHKRLVAYVVGDARARTDTADLRRFVGETLPGYMVPSAFVPLDAMPLTPNGKIDRKALPAPDGDHQSEATYRAPHTPEEELLASVWSQLLQVDRVGLDDHFFHLGGHSLLATRVVSRVRELFGVKLALRSVFEAPTLAGMAQKIVAARSAGHKSSSRIVPRPRDVDPPLSFAQDRMWFLERLTPDTTRYIVPTALRLRGPLEIVALERSLRTVIARHEALRTTYSVRDGQPYQRIADTAELEMTHVDLRHRPGAERMPEATRLGVEAARRSFDLERGPLVRLAVIAVGDDDHVFVLAAHHIAVDGWSTALLCRELAAGYAAALAHRDAELPPVAIQYADFAVWQRTALRQVIDEQVAYWVERLRGAPLVHSLPTDRPRRAFTSHRASSRDLHISSALSSALKRLSRAENATLFMTLLAAFHALLHRHSGSDDIVVGSPVANRTREETESVIGFFVNMLPLRVDLAGAPSFRELLVRVRETALGAYANQDAPFEKLVERLNPDRSLGYEPVFQIAFALQPHAPPYDLAGITASDIDLETNSARFDLELHIRESTDELAGTIWYATDLFDDATIERLLGHYVQLLEGILADPGRRITALPLFGDRERHQLTAANDAALRLYPPVASVHAMFEGQAATTPEHIAVTCECRTLTYAELDARANQLAHYLRAHGVATEARVGILMERSLDMAVALIATLKAGAAYVPLDPEYPAARLAYMIRDARPTVVLTQYELAVGIPQHAGTTIAIDTIWDEIARLPTSPPHAAIASDNLAYVIYTSGSTGMPKGAANTHAGAVNHLCWLREELALGPDDRVLQKTSFSFDASVWELFLPLVCGARVVFAKPGGHRDPAYLAAAIRDEKITVVQFVPTMLAPLLDRAELEHVRSVRLVCAGGEALPGALAARARQRLRADVINLYGPTEASVDTSFWRCTTYEPAVVPIGRPVANVRIHVLDRELAQVPIGVAGEIYVAGIALARGYFARAALTAERFVPDPVTPGGRLYRTGDRGRFRADGALEFLGRVDHQVKVRGFRIELGEIEAVLAQHPTVAEAVVVAREDGHGAPRLVAYVIQSPDNDSADALAPKRFANVDRFVRAVSDAIDRLPSGGTTTIRGVRNFQLLDAFHASATLVSAAPSLTSAELRARFLSRRTEDRELAIDPALFSALGVASPELAAVDVVLSDTDRFRYDVVLTKRGSDTLQQVDERTIELDRAALDVDEICRALADEPAILRAIGARDERLVRDLKLVELFADATDTATATELRSRLAELRTDASPNIAAIDPRYDATRAWSASGGGHVDIVFRHRTKPSRSPLIASGHTWWAAYANQPYLGDVDVTADLRAHVEAALPDHMVPSAFMVLTELPRTPNGKLDRAALPSPEGRPAMTTTYVAPRTPIEEQLAAIWINVLGVSEVGVEDDFFALGGHSLLAVQLIARIGVELGADVSLGALFEAPTIAALATRIEPERTRETREAVVRLGRAEGPAGMLQPYSWACELAYAGADFDIPTESVPAVWRLRGAVDANTLARALHAIGARHEVMRTTYAVVGNELRQIVRPVRAAFLPALEFEDWTSVPRDEAAFEVTIGAFAKRRFDLVQGPVVRAKLIRIAPEDHALVLVIHHIAYDGPTGAMFYRELAAAYRSQAPTDPPLPLQFVDVASYLRARLDTVSGRADTDYWTSQFAGVPPLAMPVDFARGDVDAARTELHAATGTRYVAHFPAAQVALTADRGVTERVVAAARRERVTMLVYLLAGLGELLHLESGQRTFAIQTALDVRPMLGAESLMGGFNSPVFLRVAIDVHTTRRDMLVAMRDRFAQAYEHALVSPMQLLPAHLGRVNFGFVGDADVAAIELGDAVGAEVELDVTSLTPFDLRPGVALAGGQLTVWFQYNTRLFKRETCERLCARYLDVLRAMADNLDGVIADASDR